MRAAIFAATLLFSTAVLADPVRIVSWNINNLHHTEGEGIPDRDNVPIRTRADYERLRAILSAPALSGDIIAFQETNGPEAVRKVLPDNAAEWAVCHESRFDRDAVGNFSPATKPDRIYTAVAVKRARFDEVRCTELPIAVVGEDGRPTRNAAGAGIRRGATTFHVFSIHMKSQCHQDSIDEPEKPDCRVLSRHTDELERAIDDLTRRGIAFVLAGDFNRRFNREGFDDQTDELWLRIDDGTPVPLDLERAPKGSTGPCWPGENPAFRQPIDFFIFNQDIWPLVVKDAQGRPDYHKLGLGRFAPDLPRNERNKVSDHCPIRTTINLPRGDVARGGTFTGLPAVIEAIEQGNRETRREGGTTFVPVIILPGGRGASK
jgi:endonuclease/exonuclease/phosphatase family metal-dependent hydrolase